MHFTRLKLQQFRNYPSLDLALHPGITVLYGANGSGKTNLLEAMHLLSLGRSHRTTQDKEMVAADCETAIVQGYTRRLDGEHEIEIRLYPHQKPQKKLLLYRKPAQRIGDLMGHATVVMFSPEDIRIIRDGPAARRRFIDMLSLNFFIGISSSLHISDTADLEKVSPQSSSVTFFTFLVETP